MSAAERLALVDGADPGLLIAAQCRLLKVARSTLYYRPVPVSTDDLAVMRRMDELHLVYPFHGSRRLAVALPRDGWLVTRKRVKRLMQVMALETIYQKPNTSRRHPDHKVYPYPLRGLVIDRANQVWCAHITYIPMAKGFVYLAAVMDWFSRRVLAWRVSTTVHTAFCVEALQEALGRHGHAIGMERLSTLMDKIFSLSLSDGTISNVPARAREPLLAAARTIRATVLASPMVRSDETPAFAGQALGAGERQELVGMAVDRYPGRAARDRSHSRQGRGSCAVRRDRADGLASDMLRSQRRHTFEWQVCLAHLLRDATYAIECGDTAFSAAFKRLLLRAIAIGRRRDELKDITLTRNLADLDRRLNRTMAAVPVGELGRKLRKRIAANRAHLFVFVTNRSVPYANNVSERHLRPSVIYCKVTNGFRCEWGAETYAAFGSLVSTAKANRACVLEVLRFVLAAKLPTEPAPGVG